MDRQKIKRAMADAGAVAERKPMSDQVTITVHRRLPDGTWPPGEEPPKRRFMLTTNANPRRGADIYGTVEGKWIVDGYGNYMAHVDDLLAWADVTDVFAGGREAKP